VPPQNPITEPKRVLGKILFWDEQLSSTNTVACGTRHRPATGGADPRFARHPGRDNLFQTPDDVFGSLGIVRTNAQGQPVPDPIFGLAPQVTRRAAQPFLTAEFAPSTFWDGRAGGTFIDPETQAVVIPAGGALENQTLDPILSDVEMAHEGRTWADVEAKLAASTPLALARDLPPDVASAIDANPTYPLLFTAAFGTPALTASRIAMAIATYERTLVANQTPWDAFNAGNPNALTPEQQAGLNFFRGSACAICHQAPFFTNHTFRNIGLRPIPEDSGRQEVTGQPADAGRFKVPSLRNVGLKAGFMHNGRLATLTDVINFYRTPVLQFPQNRDPLVPVPVPQNVTIQLVDFLANGLTDPRVAAEIFPFDRPTLLSEVTTAVAVVPLAPGAGPQVIVHPAYPNPFNPSTTLRYRLRDAASVRVSIMNPLGQEVRRLADGPHAAGEHALSWDGQSDRGGEAASGVYFFRVTAGSESSAGRLVLAR
jgi:cytochrome c peroxidase